MKTLNALISWQLKNKLYGVFVGVNSVFGNNIFLGLLSLTSLKLVIQYKSSPSFSSPLYLSPCESMYCMLAFIRV